MLNIQAQRAAYAVLKLAPYVRRKELRVRLEESALDFFVAVGLGNTAEIIRQTEALLGLIKLGQALYEVEIVNGDMLIDVLKDVMDVVGSPQTPKTEVPDAAVFLDDAAKIFTVSGKTVVDKSIVDRQWVAERSAIDSRPIGNGLPNVRQSEDDELPISADQDSMEDYEDSISDMGSMVSIGSAIRYSAIIEKIGSMSVKNASGEVIGCRMKDLITAFPGISERTLRNDLQRLLNTGKIERHGAGGFSVYVIK